MFRLFFRTVARTGMHWKRLHTCIPALCECKPEPRLIQNMEDNVHPSANIKIKTNARTSIDSYSIHSNLNCDDFHVSLFDKSEEGNEDSDECSDENRKAEFFVRIDDKKKNVEVKIQKHKEDADVFCEMHIPHNCNIIINSTDAVSIARVFGNRLTVRAAKDIELRTVRVQNILLSTDCGKIQAHHILLGGIIQMDTKNGNGIALGNVIGTKMFCKTDGGNISTTSCFVEESCFESNTGNFQLNNVHKYAKVIANDKANIDIRGLRGRLEVLGKSSGDLKLHMSKILGDCCINCDEFNNACLFVSDNILKSIDINVISNGITLDESLQKQAKGLSSDKKTFHSKGKGKHKLVINTKKGSC